MTGGGSLPSQLTGLPEYIGREVVQMTAYEIIMFFWGIIGLLREIGENKNACPVGTRTGSICIEKFLLILVIFGKNDTSFADL